MNKKDALVKVHTNLEKLLQSKTDALPSNFNQTRFIQNAMTVLQDTKNIEKMAPTSVARTMLKGAFLGLDFFMGECYAIPYGDELQFQTDYKGEVKLSKMYSLKPITDIYAKLVRVGDEFQEVVIKGVPSIHFKPAPFNKNDIVGAFAVCLYTDGTMIYESMSTEEIENVRKTFSKMPDGKAWKNSWGEMAKKSVLRRLTKMIETEFSNTEQIEAYKAGGDLDTNAIDAEIELGEDIAMPTVEPEAETPTEQELEEEIAENYDKAEAEVPENNDKIEVKPEPEPEKTTKAEKDPDFMKESTGRFTQWADLDEDQSKDALSAIRDIAKEKKENLKTVNVNSMGDILKQFSVKSLSPTDMSAETYWQIYDYIKSV